MLHHPVTKQNRSNARAMRKAMTDAELKLWNEFRAHRLMGLSFRRQLPIGPYIVDFACPDHKLIVEVDGVDYAEDNQAAYDQKRTDFLETQGWQVIRFWNREVLRDIDATCLHIIKVLEQRGVVFA